MNSQLWLQLDVFWEGRDMEMKTRKHFFPESELQMSSRLKVGPYFIPVWYIDYHSHNSRFTSQCNTVICNTCYPVENTIVTRSISLSLNLLKSKKKFQTFFSYFVQLHNLLLVYSKYTFRIRTLTIVKSSQVCLSSLEQLQSFRLLIFQVTYIIRLFHIILAAKTLKN